MAIFTQTSGNHAWIDAYLQLREVTIDARGATVFDAQTDEPERAPSTIGADVFAIAAAIDPIARKYIRNGDVHALADRWRAMRASIEREALPAPLMVFCKNRAFWRTLAEICVYLSMQDAEFVPEPIWNALIAQLGEHLRNAGPTERGPFGAFEDARTFDDLFRAQRNYLLKLRGEDMLDPDPGEMGGKTAIPRTTNADVVALADYWGRQLDRVKDLPGGGYDAVAARWKVARADVETTARHGDPAALYAKNNSFWRALQATAMHVAVTDEHPSRTEMMLDSLKTSIAHLPGTLAKGVAAVADTATDIAGRAAHGVGNVAREVGRGIFGGLGTPLLIGGGLVGLYFLTRNRSGGGAPPSVTAAAGG